MRKAKIIVFKNEPPNKILEDVDDTSGLLCDLVLEEKDETEPGTNPEKYTTNIMPNVVKINLKRSRVASDNLLVFLREEDIDVGIIQEPWTRKSTVMGQHTLEYNTLYTNSTRRPRACIIIKKHLKAHYFPA